MPGLSELHMHKSLVRESLSLYSSSIVPLKPHSRCHDDEGHIWKTLLGNYAGLTSQTQHTSRDNLVRWKDRLGCKLAYTQWLMVSLAGTGKSFLLNQIISYLRSQYEEDFVSSVAICASTGIAATHVGGTDPPKFSSSSCLSPHLPPASSNPMFRKLHGTVN